ncbi:hypothetical protein RVIR1_09340 [Candidatus Rickettsiella viridis]|uniref:Uncharacterized protein n=1 Tax=Candidatus Rickettsiella viridis TaxID=676208 RepID=A0A2Z5UWN2_9COXI|nr:hypothetical protein RVIR1_09340 [Candidatus Rickettsiella viridis]
MILVPELFFDVFFGALLLLGFFFTAVFRLRRRTGLAAVALFFLLVDFLRVVVVDFFAAVVRRLRRFGAAAFLTAIKVLLENLQSAGIGILKKTKHIYTKNNSAWQSLLILTNPTMHFLFINDL